MKLENIKIENNQTQKNQSEKSVSVKSRPGTNTEENSNPCIEWITVVLNYN